LNTASGWTLIIKDTIILKVGSESGEVGSSQAAEHLALFFSQY